MRPVFALACLLAATAMGALPGRAHIGHDHGAEEEVARPPAYVAPRSSALIGNQEVVVTYDDGTLTAYLHRYSDGRPTQGATVDAVVDFLPDTLTEIAPGVYQSDSWVLVPGESKVELSYEVDGRAASTTLTLLLPESADGHDETAAAGDVGLADMSVGLWAAGGLGTLAAAGALWRRQRQARGGATYA